MSGHIIMLMIPTRSVSEMSLDLNHTTRRYARQMLITNTPPVNMVTITSTVTTATKCHVQTTSTDNSFSLSDNLEPYGR